MLSMHLLILLSVPSGAIKSSLCEELRSYKVSIVFESSVTIQILEAECGFASSLRLITELGHDKISSSFHKTFLDAIFKSIDRLMKVIDNVLQPKFADNCHRDSHRAILVYTNRRHSVRILDQIRTNNYKLFRSQLLGIGKEFLANLDQKFNPVDDNASISGYNRRCL
jgi:hypothetical protein